MTVKSFQDIEFNVQEVSVGESITDSPLAGFGCPSFVDTDTTEESFEDRYARIGVLKEPKYIEANSRHGLMLEVVKVSRLLLEMLKH